MLFGLKLINIINSINVYGVFGLLLGCIVVGFSCFFFEVVWYYVEKCLDKRETTEKRIKNNKKGR